MVWGPITAYLFLRSLFQFSGPLPAFAVNPVLPLASLFSIPIDSFVKTFLCFFVGNLIWTILEYGLHRFLFHIDEMLPDRPVFIMLHFLTHGIHHYMPMDRLAIPSVWRSARAHLWYFYIRLRLVMPPILFATLQAPFTKLAHTIFPAAMANGIISGSFAFCELHGQHYNCMCTQQSFADILYDCMHYA